MTIEIHTPRLILRSPRMEDLEEIQAAKEAVWDDLQMWMSWAYDSSLSREHTADFISDQDVHRPMFAFDKADGRFAVSTGIYCEEVGGVFSMGYWVARDKRSMGYATEATNAAIRYAFAHMNATRIDINYYGGNEPSRRVIEKLGFSHTQTIEGGHKRCRDGEPLDVHHFAMTNISPLPPLEWRLV